MTKDEGVHLYYQAQHNYQIAQSNRSRYQNKVNEWSGARSSYTRQRDNVNNKIVEVKRIIENLKSGRKVVLALISDQQKHNNSIQSIDSGLDASVRATDVISPDVDNSLRVSVASPELDMYDADIRGYENDLSELERQKRNLNTSIDECSRQIRIYNNNVENENRNMRQQQNLMDQYRRYLSM